MRRGLGVALGVLVATLASSRVADACGGCFAPPSSEQSLVTGHRMAFAVNEERTVLWDQFEYQGSPEDFSWVLPVKPGAWVEESVDAWFEALDSFTSARIFAPPLLCAQPEFSDSGCGSSQNDTAAGSAGGDGGGSDVIVKHRGTIGPYNTVTLSSQDPKALETWLEQHGYVVPDYTLPIIAAYVAEGFDFIALRLQPGKGVQQMTPVRVVTPKGDPELPLRMVAAGATSFVDITLFVLAERRYAMPDLPELSVPLDELVWDFAQSSSNYLDVRKATLAENDGRTYLTTFAKGSAFSSDVQTPAGFSAQFVATTPDGTWNGAYGQLAELYLGQAMSSSAEWQSTPASACAGVLGAVQSTNRVVDNCDPSSGECTPLGTGEISSTELVCEEWSDLATGMIGMRPKNVWVTRLEMRLPQTALDADCIVAPALSQDEVSSMLQAKNGANPPCREPIFNGSPALLFGSIVGAWYSRRRARRKGKP